MINTLAHKIFVLISDYFLKIKFWNRTVWTLLNVQFQQRILFHIFFLDSDILEDQGLFFMYEQMRSCAAVANTSPLSCFYLRWLWLLSFSRKGGTKTLGILLKEWMQVIQFTKLLKGSVIETQSKLCNPTW